MMDTLELRFVLVAVASLSACNVDTTDDRYDDAVYATFLGELDDADLTDDGVVQKLAASGSAPNVFLAGYLAMMLAESTEPCPVVTEGEESTTVAGGCTTDEGVEYVGTATVNGLFITYESFGTLTPSTECDGEVEQWVLTGEFGAMPGDTDIEFGVDLVAGLTTVSEGCTLEEDTVGMYYYGTFVYDEEHGSVDRWNGDGVIGSQRDGLAYAETVDERLDEQQCAFEALSGKTVFTAGSDEVVVNYDGATDCEFSSTVTWTRNGEEQGELEGIRCQNAPRSVLGWFMLPLLVGRFRRRRA